MKHNMYELVHPITAEEATKISEEELTVDDIRKLIFEGIYDQAKDGSTYFAYKSYNQLPRGIPLELVDLGYQVKEEFYDFFDEDCYYAYSIYWGRDTKAAFYTEFE